MEDKDLIVVKRDKTLGRGIFAVGVVVSFDADDMVVYHKGVSWPVKLNNDGVLTLLGGITTFGDA